MGYVDGHWSVSLKAAAANVSWTRGAGLGVSRQTQLLLEVLMVFMCLGAVTGTESPGDILFISLS